MQIPQEWTFANEDVAKGFDHHVREQLPWYDLLTSAVAYIGRHYIPQNGLVYDIGASTGNIGRALQTTLDSRNAELIAIEESAEMAALYDGPGSLAITDALSFPYQPFDVAICFLIFMFFPPNMRETFLDRLKENLRPGGVIIVVDKCEAVQGYPATILSRIALSHKIAAGVRPEEIIEKELSLSGVQRPLDPSILGDEAVPFFRFGEFAGWILDYNNLHRL